MVKIHGSPQHKSSLWEDFFSRTKDILPYVGGDTQLELCFGHRAELKIKSEELVLKHPFFIDFSSNKLIWRTSHGGRRSEAVARAVIGNRDHPLVFDATAGLGRDAFILQSCGVEVTMFERNPVVWALLYDALLRAREDHEFLASLINGLPKLAPFGPLYEQLEIGKADCIYYDPMFPQRRKKALVKQEMRILHVAVGPDEDVEAVLPLLLKRSNSRVVVKRPPEAQCICKDLITPSGSIDGKACRFDIYSTMQLI